MRVHLATDHAGLEFKDALTQHLTSKGYEVVDHGAYEYDAEDDYPAF
jgi:ribose 5-phosphate isomerase B